MSENLLKNKFELVETAILDYKLDIIRVQLKVELTWAILGIS